MTAPIERFIGEYNWLSNFYPVTIVYDRHTYPTAEHAFQATKARDEKNRQWVAWTSTPGEAKRRGRQILIRPDWEEIKREVMAGILNVKFALGTDLGQKLMDTGDAKLVEGNNWGDTYWGVDDRRGGKNVLGQLLMKIRDEYLEFTENK